MRYREVAIIIGVSIGIILMVSFVTMSSDNKYQNDSDFSKTELFQMHDVIVEGKIMAVTNDPKYYVVMQVERYFKNPQNATHLTIWGDFGFNSDCTDYREECYHVVAYLYKNKNGIYHEGETFGRITNSCDADCIVGTNPENSTMLTK